MASAIRQAGARLVDGIYEIFMRRTSVYTTFVVVGAYFGEQAVEKGVEQIWDRCNTGKRFQDITVLGTREEAD